VLAAEALVPGMLPQWHIRLGPMAGATPTLAHLSRPTDGLSKSMPQRVRWVALFECAARLILFVAKIYIMPMYTKHLDEGTQVYTKLY
jgi:hypothetical protein